MSTACDKVRKAIEKSAFNNGDGFYLDYKKGVCKKVFANWYIDDPKFAEKDENGKFLSSYDRNLRHRISTMTNKEIFDSVKK